MSIGEIIVWVIIGSLAGTITGRLVTRKKEGLGWWTNLVVGFVEALVGGFLFNLFGIDFGFGELKVTFEDLIAAVCGSLIFLVAFRVIRNYASSRSNS